jgi:hypothetical protein
MLLVPEAFRNHPDLMKEYPEVGVAVFLRGLRVRGQGEKWEVSAAAAVFVMKCCAEVDL